MSALPTFTRRQLLHGDLTASLSVHATTTHSIPTSTLPPPDPAIHLLNRISFGLRAEELTALQTMGAAAYVERQLNPQGIDDSIVEDVIRTQFPTLAMSPTELLALTSPQPRQAAQSLVAATLYRALFSKRQLFEVMVDFWSNHFNITQEGTNLVLKTVDDRDVIRAHALGNFRNLLHASAKSPAMLYYLDNVSNRKNGPNENYARELLELHTLGVDGGYTEADVREVARCFTGWAFDNSRNSPQRGIFRFYPDRHDTGEKLVLGTRIPARPANQGQQDGEQVLDLLASHPATAQFIATKLCRRLVADKPPASLVNVVAASFQASSGDIPNLLRTLLSDSRFLAAVDQKLKRPLEYVSAALRTTNAQLGTRSLGALSRKLDGLGQLPFDWSPPNGYPDVETYWASTNGLMNRWNFSFAVAEERIADVTVNVTALIGNATTPTQLVDRLTEQLLHRRLSDADRSDLIGYAAGNAPVDHPLTSNLLTTRARGLIGLLLSSAYFQRR